MQRDSSKDTMGLKGRWPKAKSQAYHELLTSIVRDMSINHETTLARAVYVSTITSLRETPKLLDAKARCGSSSGARSNHAGRVERGGVC